ncbi:dihydroxyacetone kinase, phosphotransfer subunit [Fictibacillus macauensis ZFHKF-1]|uniref:phosphoenolpyruvate--glycerone phosphotransferase n=1 Tax=Fictibacillus macauensis ZFHKF-1 TaxID=1196324 RepID=I8AMQ2_9BACL|nr:dihydroxyacetone kinase phosphoryl donor subunit DhaM [Fictibacillus macauensis]EIT86954.1 dihydroxyacetone kinase, phosphotransfer subunit [Fictibacillus macauensis ZFHKF-1]
MVNLILVSHSEKLAQGLKELLGEMAPGVAIHLAAGLADGSLGTDISRIEAAFEAVTDDSLLITDLGSATMNAELALELYSGNHTITFCDVPFLEGAFVAAVQSRMGQNLDEIILALQSEFQ